MSCSRRSCYFHSCIYVTLWMKFWLSSAASPREQRTRFRPKDGRIFSMWDLPTAGNSSRHDTSTVKIAVDDWFRSSDWIENGIVRDTKMSRLRHRTTTVLGSYLNGASSLPLREPRFFDAKKEGNDKKRDRKEGRNKGLRRDYFLGGGGNSKAVAISPPTTVRFRTEIPVFQSRCDRSSFSTDSKSLLLLFSRFIIFWLCHLPPAACNHCGN